MRWMPSGVAWLVPVAAFVYCGLFIVVIMLLWTSVPLLLTEYRGEGQMNHNQQSKRSESANKRGRYGSENPNNKMISVERVKCYYSLRGKIHYVQEKKAKLVKARSRQSPI